MPARGVAREDFINLDAGVIGGADAAADQFGYRLAAVVEVADALPVDGFFYPSPKQFKGADPLISISRW
ncbi:MAG: hypothetical protein WC091_03940 [Sulfuricellaceae bacterium]